MARILDTRSATLFAFVRIAPMGTLVCLFNFAETWQSVPSHRLHNQDVTHVQDALPNAPVDLEDETRRLPPSISVWLT